MALIAALLPDATDRRSLRTALHDHTLAWADSWRDLDGLVRSRPAAAAIASPRAEPRKDGALRVLRFARRYPMTPLIAWGELDARAILRLGKAGARDVIPSPHATNEALVREVVLGALGPGLSATLVRRLRRRASPEAVELVRRAAATPSLALRAPELAAQYGMSGSTLERRCERWGAPSPGRLLLWVRVLRGMAWLREPGRSVASVAGQLGYSSGAAFGRAVEATVGGRAARLRGDTDFEAALDRFTGEFRSVSPTRV